MKKLLLFLFLPVFSLAQNIQVKTATPTGNYIQLKKTVPGGAYITFSVNNNGTTAVLFNGISSATIPSGNIHASAGIYKVVGADTILKRTLFSGIDVTAGAKPIFWDGKLDDGTTATNGNYLIKILSNNVTYKWGLIGNTSKSFTNNEQYNAYTDIYDVALTDDKIYYALGYAERDNKTRYAPLNDLGRCIKVDDQGTSVSAYQVDADANNVYWAGYKDSGEYFVIAYRLSDYTPVAFSAGTQIQMDYNGNIYTNALGVENVAIHGLKVTDTFIFVSKYDTNKLVAYNKVTGAQSYVNTLANPGNITATSDNKIWAVSGSGNNFNATLYNVSGSGQLTATSLSIPCDESSSLSISPITGELAIVRYFSDQVKIYNGSTGALNTTLGLAGGYAANGPTITNNKFAFYNNSFAKFGKDGSLWVGDNGNRRMLHLSSAGAYIEMVASCGINYFVCVDIANPTRVFAGNVEYSVDYSKDLSLSTSNGWAHSKSWLSVVSGDESNYGAFTSVCTFPNGKTYALVNDRLYELREGVGAVYLASGFNGKNLEKDGSLWTRNTGNPNNIVKQLYTGYNTSTNMPNWGTAQLVADATTAGVPFNYNNNTLGAASNPSRYFFYNPNYGYVTDGSLEYHLGSIKIVNNTRDWLTSTLTPSRYQGLYPSDGSFDRSGHSENCRANVVGSNVYTHVNEELGNYTQVSYTNHFYEDGLLIGYFGNDNYRSGQSGDTKFLAGNSFDTYAYQIPNSTDNGFITGDESKHAAVQFVRVSNLNTIQQTIIPVTFLGTVTTPIPASTDLMAYLPYASDDASVIANNVTKWTLNSRNGATAFQTSIGTFSKDSIDVYCKTYNGSLSVSRYLNSSALNSWTLTGNVLIQGNENNNLEILDVNGKILLKINSHYGHLYVNDVLAVYGVGNLARLFNSFTFSYSSGALTLNYLGNTTVSQPYENGGLLSSPGQLRIIQTSGGGDQIIDLYKLKFVPGNIFAP